jgi:GxxExxY protein
MSSDFTAENAESAEEEPMGWDENEDAEPRLVCEQISEKIIGAAIAVHSALGPGLLESTYEACLAHELRKRGLAFERQLQLPVHYDNQLIDCGYRIDLLVEGEVIVELKAVDKVHPIHEAQLITYLRLAEKPVGLILNFNVQRMKDGIVRKANTKPLLCALRALRGDTSSQEQS